MTEDRVEDLLRRALEAEADRVEVAADALAVIQRRVATRRARWRWRYPMLALGSGATVAAAIILAAILGLGSCVPPTATPPAPAASGSHPASPAPSPSGTPASRVSPAASASVPVYYVGSTIAGPRLFREFHPVRIGDGSLEARTSAALSEMLDGRRARDPDYDSGWPAGAAVRSVSVAADAVTVDLAGATAGRPDPPTAWAAVQQLVWTAVGVTHAPGVRLLFDGQPQTLLWGVVPVTGVLPTAPALDILAPVWLIDPQYGDRVGRTFTVHVAGVAFEGVVRLEVSGADRQLVLTRSVQLDKGAPARGEAKVSVTLAPGTYELRVAVISARDGTPDFLDTHMITVG